MRVITILPPSEDTNIVFCNFDRISLDDPSLLPERAVDGGAICFDDYVAERFPEYLHIDILQRRKRGALQVS